jgi:hypothetical protein
MIGDVPGAAGSARSPSSRAASECARPRARCSRERFDPREGVSEMRRQMGTRCMRAMIHRKRGSDCGFGR